MSDAPSAEARAPQLRDISVALQAGVPEWPGDTPYECGWSWQIAAGASVNVSRITTSPHCGTHADAPLHVRDGWPGAHELPLEAFHGPAVVVDVGDVADDVELDLAMLQGAAARGGVSLEGTTRLLLKTGRTIGTGEFPAGWPTLAEATVRELLDRGLRLLGVDAPSVDHRESKGLPVHHLLFGAGACNLENLDLRRIAPGAYELIAFPLKVMALDAAPVRAVLVDPGHPRPGP